MSRYWAWWLLYRGDEFIQAQTPGSRDVLVFERNATMVVLDLLEFAQDDYSLQVQRQRLKSEVDRRSFLA
jgi:hypothetical protein